MTDLQAVMANLDVALTGHSPAEVMRQIHHYPKDVSAWIEDGSNNPIWYLSDSGYSRVVFGMESGKLFLTDNSRNQVKARWDSAEHQVAEAENYIRSEYENLGGPVPYWESQAARLVRDLLLESPEIATLKAHKVKLSDEEREQVMAAKAIWNFGPGPSPAVWKAVVGGKTWYVSNTHRCFQADTTLKAAIKSFFKTVEPSA